MNIIQKYYHGFILDIYLLPIMKRLNLLIVYVIETD
jgi:hypothetical protein